MREIWGREKSTGEGERGKTEERGKGTEEREKQGSERGTRDRKRE